MLRSCHHQHFLCFVVVAGSVACHASSWADQPDGRVRIDFPTNDLSPYLRTERFEDVGAYVAGDAVCALVDFRKNRVQQLFAYGPFGTLQGMLYHVDYPYSFWMEGFHAFHEEAQTGRTLYPFQRDTLWARPSIGFHDDHAEQIDFDPEAKTARFSGAALYPVDQHEAAGTCDWSVTLEDQRLTMQVEARPDQTSDEGRTGIEGTLYPLYDRIAVKGQERPIEYPPVELRDEGKWITTDNSIEFVDSFGRVPRLRVEIDGGEVALQAVTMQCRRGGPRFTGKHELAYASPMRNARSLVFRASSEGRSSRVSIEVLPNPVAVAVCPMMPADRAAAVEVICASNQQPTLELDGQPLALSRSGGRRWRGEFTPKEGSRRLVARLDDAVSHREVRAVCGFRDATQRLGHAMLQAQRKTENLWPALDGMIPMVMHRDFSPMPWGHLDGVGRVIVVFYYMPRTAMIMSAASLATGDVRYVEGALRACRSYVLKSQRIGEDGHFLAPTFNGDAEVVPGSEPWVRPSNFGIMVRGLLACHAAMKHFRRTDEARECLDLGYQVAMGLKAVSGSQGQWSTRYDYRNPRYMGGNGFVNNPHYAFWQLAELLDAEHPEKAAQVRALIADHLASMPRVTGREPLRRGTVRGDEDRPNDPQAWAAVTAMLIVQHLLEPNELARRRAVASSHAGIWASDFYIDQPEFFAHPPQAIGVTYWVGGQFAVRAHAGMYDLVQQEARAITAEHLGDQLSADAAAYCFASRLAWSMEPDGYLRGCGQHVPCMQYSNEIFVSTLDYGGVGIYALWYWRNQLKEQ